MNPRINNTINTPAIVNTVAIALSCVVIATAYSKREVMSSLFVHLPRTRSVVVGICLA